MLVGNARRQGRESEAVDGGQEFETTGVERSAAPDRTG